jgi:chromatin remodeling complex protein RSC6
MRTDRFLLFAVDIIFSLSRAAAGAVLRNIGVPRPEIEAIMEDVRKQHIDEQTSAAQLFAGADEDEEEGDGAEKSDYAVDGKFRVRDANKIAQTVAAVMKSAKSRRRQQQGKDGKEASGHEESGRGEAQKAAVTQEAVKALTGGASVAAAEKQEKVSSTRYVQEVRLSPELLHAPSVGDE